MKIEKFKKISEGKYRIVLDNGVITDIYEDVIVRNNLLYKKEIDLELLNKIEDENKYQEAYNISLKYISVRLRSVNEIRLYLKKKNIDEIIIDKTIERLIKNKFLNDEVFTKAFIKDKLNFTTMGKYKLINELTKLKIDSDVIYKYIEEIDDDVWYERMDKLINKYIKSKKKSDARTLKNKLYIYLINLGYDKNLVINVINNFEL